MLEYELLAPADRTYRAAVPPADRAEDELVDALSAIAVLGAAVDATTATVPELDDVGSVTDADPLPSVVVTVPPLVRPTDVLSGVGVAE
jgi:hypothetical protein